MKIIQLNRNRTMITFENDYEMVRVYEAANGPLPLDLVETIREVSRELRQQRKDPRWAMFDGICGACEHRQAVVIPLIAIHETVGIECEACGMLEIQEIKE